MYAVATFLIVAVLPSVFTQLSTAALIATGVPPGIASFRARSAFSGAGFTTTEAENHPTRRRIIAATMFTGSLGTPTLVVTVLLVGNRPMKRILVRAETSYTQQRLLPVLSGERRELISLGAGFGRDLRCRGSIVGDAAQSPRARRRYSGDTGARHQTRRDVPRRAPSRHRAPRGGRARGLWATLCCDQVRQRVTGIAQSR